MVRGGPLGKSPRSSGALRRPAGSVSTNSRRKKRIGLHAQVRLRSVVLKGSRSNVAEKKNRPYSINVRLDEDDYEAVKQLAKKHNMSRSELMRAMLKLQFEKAGLR